VYVFFYVLAAMGIAYWAQRNGRNLLVWFTASVLLTPIGSVALMIADRYSL
jgi:hypothetical protein